MKAPLFISKGTSRRARGTATGRKVSVLGKPYVETSYIPKFALGIMCVSEAEQIELHQKLSSVLAGREIKVLVI